VHAGRVGLGDLRVGQEEDYYVVQRQGEGVDEGCRVQGVEGGLDCLRGFVC